MRWRTIVVCGYAALLVCTERSSRAAESLSLADMRYKAGYSGYLDVLDAQRTHNDAQMSLVEARRSRLAGVVDLYKALGGGWTGGAK